MKVDVGEGSRTAGAVADDRHIHQGYAAGNDTEGGRSGPNRAVAVAQQQHQAGGASGASGSVIGGTVAGVVDGGLVGVGLPVRNGALRGAGNGGAAGAVVALHQHGGNSVDGRAFLESDEYRRQVGDPDLILLAVLAGLSCVLAGLVYRF